MRLALIYTPTFAENNWTAIRAQERNLGIIPPLSLLYVAAIAEQAGHQVIIIDTVAQKLSVEDVISELEVFSPDILGFTMTTYMFHQALSWIREIKKRMNLPILIGGQHLGTYPKETMTHKEIDYAVVGEAEITLPQFFETLEKGKSLEGVNGLAFRQNGKTIFNSPQDKVMEIDKIPFPARHLVDNAKYYNVVSRRKKFTAMVTTRGCPFHCIFCDLKKAKWRMRSPQNIADEMEECYKDFGVREIDFYDSSFTANKQRVLEICKEIRQRKLDIIWSIRTRVDCVDKEMLKELSRSGCVRIMFGIESADPEILKTLRKGISVDQIRKIIAWTKEYNIEALGFFIIGSPGETRETAQKTIQFACELPLDWVQFTKMTPFPATELYQMMMEDTGEDYWSSFVLNPANEKSLPLVRTRLTPLEAKQLVRQAYLKFYFRPKRIFPALKKMRSLNDFNKAFHAALDTLILPPVTGDPILDST
ncbi:radical SAM protein [Candidatus Microgenomates bacterium]|nr:radical SAM protein [Candidatus Microgenomates bacterium]